jgi:hypothetical protein
MKKSHARWLALFTVICIMSVVTGASAQVITFDGCVDARGIPVASILNSSINDFAIVRLVNLGRPIIQYNNAVSCSFSPETRLFWYAHEGGRIPKNTSM